MMEGKQNVADALNTHFVNIAKAINRVSWLDSNFTSLKSYTDMKLENKTFKFKYVTTIDVENMIKQLDSNKSTGADGIGPNILKLCKNYLIIPITAIINNCISKSIFPDKLKIASVIPIHKGGSREDPNNYRPISILPTISKLFERHIAIQLKTFFNDTDILYKHQSGFRESHSCQTALIRLVDSWLTDIDSGNSVGTIFLDLKKAFDLVDHDILLHKLKLYHFSNSALKLFQSYLSKRTQFVKMGGVCSTSSTINSGVPQGPILGPLLFLLYVNDLPLCIKSNADMYADDTTIHQAGKNFVEIQETLQTDLDNVNRWCSFNNMAINPKKTTCMILCTRHSSKMNTKLNLTIGGHAIQNVTTQKLLGVVIDKCLTWKPHIDMICSKLSSKLFLLRRIENYLSLDMKKMFYTGYITPIYDYGCITWKYANKTEFKRLNQFQKRFACTILRKSRRDNSRELFKQLDWLPISNRIEYFTGLMVYKSIHNLAPLYMSQLLRLADNNHYNLRSKTHRDIAQIKPRTNHMKCTFSYSGMKTWNAIPLDIRNIKHYQRFKMHYKNHLQTISLS